MTINRLDNRGSAIITALFIMTLVAIIATGLSTRLQLDIYRTRLIQNSDRLYLASQAVAFWAMDRLTDPRQSLKGIDSSGKVLNLPNNLKNIYPGVLLKGSLYDLQAKFNLNNLTDKTYLPVFFGILEHIKPKLNAEERKFILDATQNWIKGPTTSQTAHDEWLDRYIKQTPAYFPSYQPMQSISEFRTVFSVTADLYKTLLPNITTLPETTPININTAPVSVLMSLGNGLSKHDANELIKIRDKKPIKELSAVTQILEKYHIPETEITLESDYFLSVATAIMDGVTFTNYTVINRRKDKQGKILVSILSEAFNSR